MATAEFMTYKPVGEIPQVNFDYQYEVPKFDSVSFDLPTPQYNTFEPRVSFDMTPEVKPTAKAEPVEEVKTEAKIETKPEAKTLPQAKSRMPGKRLTKAEFKAKHWNRAERTAKTLGIDPNAILAQAYVESGGDDSKPLFAIKATGWKGKTYDTPTYEVLNGKRVNTYDSFRAYDSHDEAFDDYGKFIQGKRYRGALGLPTDQYFSYIHKAGYATDPNYAKVMTSVSNQFKSI